MPPTLRVGADDLGELQRQPAHGLDVRSAEPVLDRPADRRPEVERVDEAVDADEVLAQQLLQARRDPLAGVEIPGDDHDLAEEGIGELLVERQVEAHGARPT